MARVRAVIFDLDDTLYAEQSFVFSGYRAVAEAFRTQFGDPDETVAELTRIFHSQDRRLAFNALFELRGRPADREVVQAMIDLYRSHPPTISLYDDAEAALTRLRTRFKIGIITDGAAVMQEAKVAALGLRTRVDVVVLTDELGPGFGKPHPRAFELMADRLAIDPTACVYIGDNAAKDFVAPNALGWMTVRIVRAQGVYRDTAAQGGGVPQDIVHSLDEIDAILT
ncbi:MAG: HAD family hydrolase [Planctomycetes bacterium]|nr:HAD family hydrolase [Planctomycetota bacterium]